MAGETGLGFSGVELGELGGAFTSTLRLCSMILSLDSDLAVFSDFPDDGTSSRSVAVLGRVPERGHTVSVAILRAENDIYTPLNLLEGWSVLDDLVVAVLEIVDPGIRRQVVVNGRERPAQCHHE